MLVEADGPAGADDTWRRFTTPGTWPGWAPAIRGVEVEEESLSVGITGRVLGPPGVRIDFEVTDVDPDLRSWSWDVGRGAATIRMDHHVLPTPGGGTRAIVRVPGRAAPVLQPYRVPASLALRRLGADPGGQASREQVEVFGFAFATSYAVSGLAFGITPRTTVVEVGPGWLYVQYGPWRLVTPRRNIASAEVTGDFAWLKTAGPPHLSFRDHGVSFTTNGDRALCLTFHEPVSAIDPTATITHPGATLSVAEPERLAEALGLQP